MSDLFVLLSDFAGQLPGCEMTSIVNVDTGMQLATFGEADATDAEGADAFHSNLYRVVGQSLPELGVDDEPESLVISTDQTTFVSEMLGQTDYFWHVATDSDTTLGFVQAMMRKFHTDLTESVEELVG